MRDFLRKYAPDFCWCTSEDLYKMLNLYFPGCYIMKDSFKTTLCRLQQEGYFAVKPNPHPNHLNKTSPYKNLYLRIK